MSKRVLLDESVPRQLAIALNASILRINARQYVVIEPTGARPVINYDADAQVSADMPPVKPFDFR